MQDNLDISNKNEQFRRDSNLDRQGKSQPSNHQDLWNLRDAIHGHRDHRARVGVRPFWLAIKKSSGKRPKSRIVLRSGRGFESTSFPQYGSNATAKQQQFFSKSLRKSLTSRWPSFCCETKARMSLIFFRKIKNHFPWKDFALAVLPELLDWNLS